MIAKREVAIAKLSPPPPGAVRLQQEHDSDNANEAMLLLGIAEYDKPPEGMGPGAARLKLATWATQAAISRPGRRTLDDKRREEVRRMTINPDKLRWPRGKRA